MAMYLKRFSPCKNLFSLLNQQVRSFARDPFPNKLTQYLQQAKLIDSIRLALRSGSPNSINPLLQHRLLDSLVVTNALRSAPSVDSAVSLMENLKQVPNFEHSHNTIFSYATVLAKFQRTEELKAFIGDIKGGKFKFGKVSFMNLLFWYSTAGDLDEVLTTYELYKSEEKRLSTEAYNIVMGAYAQKDMNSEAVEVFRGMIDNGAIPNSRTYTILLEHLVRLGKLDAAMEPGFTHDIYSVQRMMTLLARHGNVELVDKLINKVRREEMRLPFSTLKLLIEFYGNSKNADAALKVFREDRTLCGPISKFNLMLLHSSLLRTLTKCRRDTDILDVLDEMILNGVCPDIQTFSGLIYHFARQGDIKTVQLLCSMVKQNGMELETYMYKLLIEAYCKSQRAPLALRVFEDMRNSNLMPDAATKDLLVKSLWEEGRRKEAVAVEESFEDTNGVLPLALRGHLWTVSAEDLSRVYSIYSNSVRATA
ncbi:hypothetical protein CCACVL1_26241 [Corchorus capsularis]|uniref:Pentatricopeptide repeat-containing protein-mitochondrial domain-containing protein n=1 Tax=Corchorus capsularis TaxID=210143 RepID=A0A1R3GFG2_COCAP|nr:hypothetical protein CCACVL1_26241 [Corchorus capsularis]